MADEKQSPRHPLLHRWFVQYNPLYLLSAALVLVGVHLLYRDLREAGFLMSQLGVPLIAEVYAWTLVGGVALLTRIGMRRPGVLLALLVVLYQGDLTLHTETSMYLGAPGTASVIAWLGSFSAKLWALSRALKLRPSRSALALPLLGALGLVVVPRSASIVGTEGASLVLGAWLFALIATGLWSKRTVRSDEPLDGWGRTVLRRTVTATWAIWSTLVALHVLFWMSHLHLSYAVLGPVALLLATRFAKRELPIWAAVTAAILWAGIMVPGAMWLTALLGAITLALHAFRRPRRRPRDSRQPASTGPYRQADAPPAPTAPCRVSFRPAPMGMRRRLLTGSLMATYLALWTAGWSGGVWPDHVLALDVMLTIAVLIGYRKLRLREPLAGLVAVYVHYATAVGWLTAPDTRLEWGLSSVGAGFALLLVSLAVSYWLRPRPVAADSPESASPLRPC